MARRLPDFIDDLAIIQGETWKLFNIVDEGDYTNWNYRGQIRSDTLQNGGTLLATFSFGVSVYDGINTTTPVIVSLTETKKLPTTIYQGSTSGKTLKVGNAYIADIERELGGVVDKKAPSFVQVIGEACSDV